MTHQLIGDVIDAFGRHLQQVRITEVRDNIFYAELILDRNTRVSARVSDAVALALHRGIPIHAEDTVLDAAAVTHTPIRNEGDDAHRPTRSSSSAGSSTPHPPRTSTRTDSWCPVDARGRVASRGATHGANCRHVPPVEPVSPESHPPPRLENCTATAIHGQPERLLKRVSQVRRCPR
jgi:hypothetical protein